MLPTKFIGSICQTTASSSLELNMNTRATRLAVPAALHDALKQTRRLVVFTGAGMSAESGIPTFRDPLYGLWEQFNPHDLASVERWEADRERVWVWYECPRNDRVQLYRQTKLTTVRLLY